MRGREGKRKQGVSECVREKGREEEGEECMRGREREREGSSAESHRLNSMHH